GGFRWDWQFTYVDAGIRVTGEPGERPVLRLPVGRTVRFRLHADDVIHSFWVPEFGTKRDLIPGLDNEIDIDIVEAGTWTGRCAEYCGLDHATMDFEVQAMPADEFDAWLDEAAADDGADPAVREVTG
ncbi:MAG: cytochrome c oxidase subunit II, partial [Acidimicrobiales bacterium]